MALEASQPTSEVMAGPSSPARRWRLPLILAGLALAIACLIMLLRPSLMAGISMSAGGRALSIARQHPGDPAPVATAIASFEQARRWAPGDPFVYRQLGQAHLLRGDAAAAVAALEEAYRLQPEGILVRQELAAAYEAAREIERAGNLWAASGVTVERMEALGDSSFALHQFHDAFAWYTYALNNTSGPTFDLRFRQAVAAILAGQPQTQEILQSLHHIDHSFLVYPVSDNLVINGSNLRWITPIPDWQIHEGTPLAADQSSSAGFFWWSGEAIVVVAAEQNATYELYVHVRHSAPPPVEMAFGVNGKQIRHVALGRGDGSWETISFPVHLLAGPNTVNVWFLNNAVIGNQDRDAGVEWIMLTPS